MHIVQSSLCVAVACGALVACGSGEVQPHRIEGGGVADPGIDGKVYVHVIAEETGAPIAGATVHLGADHEGATDDDGLFAAEGGLVGAQTITARAAGRVPTTWVGVDGANVTIPLPRSTPAPAVAQGAVSGTITGWDAMSPPPGRALIAVATYSWNHDDDDPANQLAQPDVLPPPNVCFKLTSEPCAWSLTTRTGRLAIVAFLGDIGEDGVPRFTGLAYATGIEVGADQAVSGVALTVAGAAELVEPRLTLASPPTGTDRVQALVRMDLGDDGRLLLPRSPSLSVPVPATARFPGSSYDVIGIADLEASAGETGPQSIALVRDLATLDGVTVGPFLALPAELSTDGTTFAFAPPAGATLHLFTVTRGDGTAEWNVAILGGAAEVIRPTPVSLPAGPLIFAVSALDLPGVDLRDFTLDEAEAAVTRAARRATTYAQ
jgi:hypothetical protein